MKVQKFFAKRRGKSICATVKNEQQDSMILKDKKETKNSRLMFREVSNFHKLVTKDRCMNKNKYVQQL